MPGYHGYPTKIIVASCEPQIRTTVWESEWDDYPPERKQFIYPYGTFAIGIREFIHEEKNIFQLANLKVFWNHEPFEFKMDQKIYGLPILNTDSGFNICFYNWPIMDDIKKLVKETIFQYWSSPFKNYADTFSFWHKRYQNIEPRFLADWEKASKNKDYNFIFRPLISGDYTVDLGKAIKSTGLNESNFEYVPDLSAWLKNV